MSQRSYPETATEAAFLLGGIGTGNVSIGARGELRDWEMFNRPGKGNHLAYSFFAVRVAPVGATAADSEAITRVLEARLQPPYSRPTGFHPGEVAGLPRFGHSTLRGEYPFVWVDLEDDGVPLAITLEAFTPFVPLDADASGFPAAVLRYRVRNTGPAAAEVSVCGSLLNAVGFNGYELFGDPVVEGSPRNVIRADGLTGVYCDNPDLAETDLRFGSMTLATTADAAETTTRPRWLKSAWWGGIADFWDDFRTDGRLETEPQPAAHQAALGEFSPLVVGSLAVSRTLEPGSETTFEFVLAWHFPNRPRGWNGHIFAVDGTPGEIERNWYAHSFDDAWHVARRLVDDLPQLERHSRDFHRALFGSTLPTYVIDAVAANITVLRSTTCFRIADGTLLGWEGTFDQRGSCEGSCTHVWNYAQTLAWLFPELERSMRRVEFLLETDADGRMAFRSNRVFGGPAWDMLPAADGQPGTIVRLYRDWRISGDDEFLRQVWPGARRALEFGFGYWDRDGDFVPESQQHNTYDIEFYGQNSLTTSIWLAALVAASRIAAYLGDEEDAQRYREAARLGGERMDERLWNGEYYIQLLDDAAGDAVGHDFQYGDGCLSDQVLGQLLAHVAGLGYVLPADHVRSAVAAVFRHNFRASLADHHSTQRTYALNDEPGLLLCSWPRGGRPRLPFVYADEVWTGIEYQVAAHLIYEGLVDEGLTVVRAVRERHDGFRRNPWNEVECGNHYARSMASWAVYLALTGMRADLVDGRLSFDPVVNADDFAAFWITGTGWGIYRQRRDAATGELERDIEVLYGKTGV